MFESLLLNDWSSKPAFFSSLNYILIAMALGGGLLPVDRLTPVRVGGGLAIAVLLQLAFIRLLGPAGWAPVTLSFNLITLTVFHASRTGLHHPAWLNFQFSPEERYRHQAHQELRFPIPPVPLASPVLGPWTVSQGENGPWSHQHDWKHAIDLILTGADGKPHRGNPLELSSYHAWDKPIISPAAGIIETAVGHLPDLPIGQVDTEQNWGNHVILRLPSGLRVLLAHFKQHSLQVVAGQTVQLGDWQGACGNSGYSPEPHLHLHVQQLPGAGSPTLPFSFQGVAIHDLLGRPHLPLQGQVMDTRETDPFLVAALSYPLGLQLEAQGPDHRYSRIHVSMRQDGSFQLESDRGRLPFFRAYGIHTFTEPEGNDPFFECLYQAMPSLPLYARIGDTWSDITPRTKPSSPRPLSPLVFFRNPSEPQVRVQRKKRTVLHTWNGRQDYRVMLHADRGIERIQCGTDEWTLTPIQKEIALLEAQSETTETLHGS